MTETKHNATYMWVAAQDHPVTIEEVRRGMLDLMRNATRNRLNRLVELGLLIRSGTSKRDNPYTYRTRKGDGGDDD